MTKNEVMQMALDALEYCDGYNGHIDVSEEIEALRAALAQQNSSSNISSNSEPVAWTVRGLITDFSRDFSLYKTKTYTVPLYTAPPQRKEWVGLTDEEIEYIYAHCNDWGKFDYERKLEAKLKEKNT